MKIIIDRKSNGAVVSFVDGEEVEDRLYKFEHPPIGEVRVGEDLLELLHTVVEVLGMGGGRYDRERVAIRIEHGDKFECKEGSRCDICSISNIKLNKQWKEL